MPHGFGAAPTDYDRPQQPTHGSRQSRLHRRLRHCDNRHEPRPVPHECAAAPTDYDRTDLCGQIHDMHLPTWRGRSRPRDALTHDRQRLRVAARPQGRKAARPQGRKAARPQGRKAARPQGRKAARPQGRKAARPQGHCTAIMRGASARAARMDHPAVAQTAHRRVCLRRSQRSRLSVAGASTRNRSAAAAETMPRRHRSDCRQEVDADADADAAQIRRSANRLRRAAATSSNGH
ncbi:hypothetical protein DFR70_11676 [Nocardia tenerifensis]|uniref:Uncharacterized protein n=1 Tax=Nocardia tenerifensis TaxID=228006 RepID=A0A318JVH2_9NOCA|nr:hypothetical protein DFR70_11676 [Nocardia tenerifensis]